MAAVNWFGVFAFVVLDSSVGSGQVIEKILSAKEDDRVAMIVEELEANADETARKVIDARWSYSGKYPSMSFGDADQHRHRSRGTMHLIMGQDRSWAHYDNPFDTPDFAERIDTYQAGKTHSYRIKDSRIIGVNVHCELPPILEDLKFYCELTYFAPWREGKDRFTPKNFQAFLSSCTWVGEVASEGNKQREISIMRTRPADSKHPRMTQEKIYRFSEISGRLVFCGTATHLLSPQKYNGEEYDVIDDFTTSIEHRMVDGVLLPCVFRTVLTTRSTNLDGTPYKTYKPQESRSVTWKLQSAKLMDRFPENVFDISVPPTARIVDYCRNQQERSERKQIANSGWTRMHWLIVGVVLCCMGVSLLWFRHQSR